MTNNDVTSRQGGANVRIPPPLVYAVAAVAGWLLPGLRVHGHHALRLVLGGALFVGAFLLGLAAVGLFRKTGQNPTPWLPTPKLVFDGPFRFTRNPMYVGFTGMTVAIAVLSGHFWIALLTAPALLAVHFTAVVPEERHLTAKFGAEYTEYTKRVRRY